MRGEAISRPLLEHWPRARRFLLLLLADGVVVTVSIWLAFLVRFDGKLPPRYLAMLRILILLVLGVKLPIFVVFRIYRFSLVYIGLEELLNVTLACVTASLAMASLLFLLHGWPPLIGLPRASLAMDFAFTLLGVAAVRLAKRTLSIMSPQRRNRGHGKRTVVIGAGEAGEQLVRALKRETEAGYEPIGFLDDDPKKRGLVIHGVPVLGPRAKLPALVALHRVEAVIIAMPSVPPKVIRETVELARESGVKDIKVLPFLSELYTGEVRVSDVREVRPEDVLPRQPASVDLDVIEKFLRGKRVLVTGAAGSIGSELCRQVLRFSPELLIALDFDETELFYLELELKKRFPDAHIKAVVSDIRDRPRIQAIFDPERPQVIFHAAAYKHVPMMEANPEEAVKTNIFGTKVVVEEACRVGAEAFVLISTDKAVNPVSIMGMSKRVAELITVTVGERSSTRCMAVRFGNVLGSRGSVIPIFLEQIRHGGPVTVTHPEMERYFMTTSEAVLLVLQAATLGKGGEVFVLDMGKPVKILDIARELIRFHGLEPDKDIPIVFTGIRPGEKLREEILTAEEGTEATRHRQIYVAKMSKRLSLEGLQRKLGNLAELIDQRAEGDKIKAMLAEIIHGSAPPIAEQRGGAN